MPISSTRLSCPLHDKVYGMSSVGNAFDPGESASTYSTLIRPPPSSPCRIAPDLGSCSLPGVLSFAPASPTATGLALQQGSLAPRTLLRFSATTSPTDTVSPSATFPVCRLYDLPCSIDFAMGRGRFLQLLSMPLSPCCPYCPAEVSRRFSQLRRSMLPSPKERGLGLQIQDFRGHLWVYLHYGPVTCSPS